MKVCKVPGCPNKILAKGYCNKHYIQKRKLGFIQKRTMFDPPEFVFLWNTCQFKLYNRKNIPVAETVIDLIDWGVVKKFRWHLSDKGYVRRRKPNNQTQYLHHFFARGWDNC